MRMFADENLFEPVIDYLNSLGHDILSIRGAGFLESPMMKFINWLVKTTG